MQVADAQPDKRLTGKWKFIKLQSKTSSGFDLDSLTTFYKQFFYNQKHYSYHDTITANDSLYINVLFEVAVNVVNKMFISFKSDHHYATDHYDREGNLTDKIETGTYNFNSARKEIYIYRDGNKNRARRFKIIFLDKRKLIIASGLSSDPDIFTCRKIDQ